MTTVAAAEPEPADLYFHGDKFSDLQEFYKARDRVASYPSVLKTYRRTHPLFFLFRFKRNP